jgi:hypothetical protein
VRMWILYYDARSRLMVDIECRDSQGERKESVQVRRRTHPFLPRRIETDSEFRRTDPSNPRLQTGRKITPLAEHASIVFYLPIGSDRHRLNSHLRLPPQEARQGRFNGRRMAYPSKKPGPRIHGHNPATRRTRRLGSTNYPTRIALHHSPLPR